MPPLYRIDAGKQVLYALDDAERDGTSSASPSEPTHQTRGDALQGPGRMNPTQLRETTIDPRTRRLVQLTIEAKDRPIS